MGAFIDCIKSIYVFLGGISGCIVSLIIIGLFAYALFLIISSWCHAKRTIFKFKTAFKKYQNIDRQALNELSNEFDKVQEIKVWKKFENNLVVKKDKSGDEVFYTIYPVKDFFDLNLVGGDLVSNKFITVTPALLTGLGLFGTFLGLTTGLSGVNLEAEDLGPSIKDIIEGASTAFVTSLVGILASLIVNFFDKLAINRIKKSLNRLREIVYNLFPLLKIEENFVRIEEHNASMCEVMETLAEKIGNKMQEGMLEATSKMNEEISSALDKLVQSTQSWGERVTNGSEGVLSSLISEFIDKIGENANSQRELMENSANKMSGVVSALDEMMTKYNIMTNDSFENIQKQQEEANKKHLENLDSYNNKLIEVSENVFEKQEKHTKILDGLLDKCANVSEELSSELQSLKDNLMNVNGKIAQIIDKFNSSIQNFEAVSSQLGQAGEVFHDAGEKLVEPMNKTLSSFDELASKTLDVQTKINSVSENLESLLSESEDVVNSVNALLENSNNTFNVLSKNQNEFLQEQKSILQDMSEKTSEAFAKYSESLRNQTNKRLEEWNEKTQQFSSAMYNTVSQIQSVVEMIENKSK